MFRTPLALFVVATLTAGCSIAPVQYVPVYYPAQTQSRLVMPQAPTGVTATAVVPMATASAPVQAAPVIIVQPAPVYVQQQPLYYNPVLDIAAGYLIWRGIVGGYRGHHRR